MRRVCLAAVLCVCCVTFVYGVDVYWYDGARTVRLFQQGYSETHKSYIYTQSPSKHAQKQVLTGRVVVVLDAPDTARLHTVLDKYQLIFIKQLPIGQATYLLATSDGSVQASLPIANSIYEQHQVRAAYPDWQFLW